MIHLGIDPGKTGGIVALEDHGGVLWAQAMPVVVGRGRSEYDLRALVNRLPLIGQTRATMERGQPMPASMGGGVANFQRGYGRGIFEGIFAALQIPYTLASPRQWQTEMLRGIEGSDTKQRALIACGRLWPSISLVLEGCRKPHQGIADAMLIAEWGRRQHAGGAAGGAA